MRDTEIKDLLDFYVDKINSLDFIIDDPVQFPRMFSTQADIEIAALLAATIAWGKRSMIIRDAKRMFELMDYQPYNYVMDRGYEDLPDINIHRTFFARDLRHWLRGLHYIYTHFANLDAFAVAHQVGEDHYPAVKLASMLNVVMHHANDGIDNSRCLPLNLQTTALKRLNMALRWLVRDDGIVDLGIWNSIKPSQLRIPLDVHVSRTSKDLGLISRKSADRKAVEELTTRLAEFNPTDPVRYDFALFGIGVKGIEPNLL